MGIVLPDHDFAQGTDPKKPNACYKCSSLRELHPDQVEYAQEKARRALAGDTATVAPSDPSTLGRDPGETQSGCESVAPASEDRQPSTALSTYVDRAMFEAEEIDSNALDAPKVYLLNATPDPLGAVAAASMMYEGRVIRDLAEITDDERRHYFDECFKTTLKAPLEFIDLHLMVEGVTRAHTHQEVRQRTAVFAQESMRFAVKEGIAARPGPLTRADPKKLAAWEDTMAGLWQAYQAMIANGIPAEEARGILPHDTLTRLHHKVNLRNLIDEIGKRTCTQAQFEWRMWAASLRQAVREYKPPTTDHHPKANWVSHFKWQWEYIAESPIWQPICFSTGACMFKAAMDRGCTIRERVEAGRFEEIRTEEWLADPTAAWVR